MFEGKRRKSWRVVCCYVKRHCKTICYRPWKNIDSQPLTKLFLYKQTVFSNKTNISIMNKNSCFSCWHLTPERRRPKDCCWLTLKGENKNKQKLMKTNFKDHIFFIWNGLQVGVPRPVANVIKHLLQPYCKTFLIKVCPPCFMSDSNGIFLKQKYFL